MNRKSPSLYTRIKLSYAKLILRGVKIIEERQRQNFKFNKLERYNKYKPTLLLGSFIYTFFYIKHNYLQSEFDIRQKPNILIPKSVYNVRRLHYIYWETSRLARGQRKAFSYYNYDTESKTIYFIDRNGNNHVEKLVFNQERPDLLLNPFLEFLFKKPNWTELDYQRANLISAYYLKINDPFDLDNYLHYKPINPFDFLRWIYYYFMLYSGLADTYRNEQFLPKSDMQYNLELLLINSNMNQVDKVKAKENLQFVLVISLYFINQFLKKNNLLLF